MKGVKDMTTYFELPATVVEAYQKLLEKVTFGRGGESVEERVEALGKIFELLREQRSPSEERRIFWARDMVSAYREIEPAIDFLTGLVGRLEETNTARAEHIEGLEEQCGEYERELVKIRGNIKKYEEGLRALEGL